MIFDQLLKIKGSPQIINPADMAQRRKLDMKKMKWEDLLVPVFRKGRKVFRHQPIEEIRKSVLTDLGRMDDSIKRFENPHTYPVGLEKSLFDKKMELILRLRNIPKI